MKQCAFDEKAKFLWPVRRFTFFENNQILRRVAAECFVNGHDYSPVRTVKPRLFAGNTFISLLFLIMSPVPKVSSANLLLFAILHHASYALWLILSVMVYVDGPRGLWALLAALVSIPGIVFSSMILHRGWKLVQDGEARTTPGKAVGFCFIPFFSFYWLFVSHYGLLQEINRVSANSGRTDIRVTEGIGLTLAILAIVCGLGACFIPLLLLPYMGFEIAFLWQIISSVRRHEAAWSI